MLAEQSTFAPERHASDPFWPVSPVLEAAPDRNGLLVVGEHGRVLEMNRAAKTILDRADALTLQDGQLRALRGADDEALLAILAGALDGEAGGPLLLSRRWGGRDYVAVGKPLHARRPNPAALLVVVDPERVPRPGTELLKRVFGFTAAEARVALRLLDGRTPEEAAGDLGISGATLRVHLAHLFRKTRTNRQAELIRVLMSYPWDALTAGEANPG